MSDRLPRAHNWWLPLVLTAVPVAVIVGYFASQRRGAWLAVVEITLMVFALYAATVLVRLRAHMEFTDDHALLVRNLGAMQRVEGPQVSEVQGVFNGRSPNVRLKLTDGRKVLVPSSQFQRGHSALFLWLREYAPQATHDREAAKIGGELIRQGIL